MLRMRVIFPFLLLICSVAVASEEISSINQVEAGDPSEDASAEGRACGGCGGGTITKPTHTTIKPDIGHELLTLLLSGLGSLPVLAFNILGIVLLALLLKKLLSDDTGAAAADPIYYSAPSSYADPSTYHKRSSVDSFSPWSLQAIQDSSVGTFLTQVVQDAIDKHNVIEKH